MSKLKAEAREAETRIGELLRQNPPNSLRNEVGQFQGKRELPEGITRNQSSQFQKGEVVGKSQDTVSLITKNTDTGKIRNSFIAGKTPDEIAWRGSQVRSSGKFAA